MKLLKLILFILIFLQGIGIALGYNNPIKTHITKADTTQRYKSTKSKKSYLLSPPGPRDETLNDCIFINKYSVYHRLRKYPFSKAAKIVAVSYPFGNINPDIVYTDSSKIKPDATDTLSTGLHIENGILNYRSLKEIKLLNRKQISELTNIIFNTTHRRKNNFADPGRDCCNPRNALLFYDKNGKIFDYLQVCFECECYDSMSGKIRIGAACNQKFDLLRRFFIHSGIKYGTKER